MQCWRALAKGGSKEGGEGKFAFQVNEKKVGDATLCGFDLYLPASSKPLVGLFIPDSPTLRFAQ